MNLYTILKAKDSTETVSIQTIEMDVRTLFEKNKAESGTGFLAIEDTEVNRLAQVVYSDLSARVEKDPTSVTPSIVYYHSRAFLSIYLYRIANFVFYKYEDHPDAHVFSYHLSEFSSASTGIEIHYKARIGERFVIDHGSNTVIGETTVIGKNCTLLNNVILGAKKVEFNQKNDRHPVLGDNVQIASGVKVLGRILIGHNVKIGPDCIITKDVEDDTTVKMAKEYIQYKHHGDHPIVNIKGQTNYSQTNEN